MKRLMIAGALTMLLTVGMTSCKKDYDCECRDGNVLETTTYPNTGLVDARNACKDRQSFYQNSSHPGAECTIL